MSKIKHFFRGRKWLRNLVTILLCLVVVGGVVGGVIALTRNTDKITKKIDDTLTYTSYGWTHYRVGGLDGSGNYMSTDQSIYTKEAFLCQGLNVDLDFDNDVSYQIYFYDQDNEFVHATGRLTGAFEQESVPFFAKYARIVVTPNDDNKVTIFEIHKYASQLNTKLYREQGFKNYTENLLEVDKAGYSLTAAGAEEVSNDPVKCISKWIQVTSYSESMIFREGNPIAGSGYVYLYDINKSFVGRITFTDWASAVFTSSLGVVYYNCEFANLSYEGVAFMRFGYGTTAPFEVFCR